MMYTAFLALTEATKYNFLGSGLAVIQLAVTPGPVSNFSVEERPSPPATSNTWI